MIHGVLPFPRRGVCRLVISLAWVPVRLHLHLSMSRRQDSANGNDPARPQGRYFHPMWLGGVGMPERATGGDAVADELFDLLDFRKAAPLLPRPDDLVIHAHLKDANGFIRGERHGSELLGKRGSSVTVLRVSRTHNSWGYESNGWLATNIGNGCSSKMRVTSLLRQSCVRTFRL